jgi:hypothetical protein
MIPRHYRKYPVAEAGASAEDRRVVAHQLAAEAGENGGKRLVKHARYNWLLLAESHLTRRLFASALGRIAGPQVRAG